MAILWGSHALLYDHNIHTTLGLGIVNDNGGRLAIVTQLKIIENTYIAMTPKIHVGTPNAI